MEREWKRYEGTPQRDLFREIRERFLDRHRTERGWSVDVGSGPGRFAGHIGVADRRVLLDLSLEMLRFSRRPAGEVVAAARGHLVRGDGARPPLRPGRFHEVVAFGNPLGFAGGDARAFLTSLLTLAAVDGAVLIEVVCGMGESSRYLRRLPPGAVRRLLSAPLNLVRARVEREGFRPERPDDGEGSGFRRFGPEELRGLLAARGFRVIEALAVAPALGSDAERIAAAKGDPAAWRRLVELEEALGHLPGRQEAAAALLVAARRPLSGSLPDAPESRARRMAP